MGLGSIGLGSWVLGSFSKGLGSTAQGAGSSSQQHAACQCRRSHTGSVCQVSMVCRAAAYHL
eukprot:2147212-Rhodomonas_salina.2